MKISICIATYNGESYISEQLCSICEQLREGDEILLTDDGSSDDTLKIVNTFTQRYPIKVVSTKRLGSPKLKFEEVIGFASNEIIVLCDQDDVWLPMRLDAIRNEFSGRPDLTLIMLNANIFYLKDGCFIEGEDLFSLLKRRNGILTNIYKNTYVGCCMAFRKEALSYILPFPKSIAMHDVWIGLLCEVFGSVDNISIPHMLYRRHDNNASSTSSKSSRPIWIKAKERCLLTFSLILRFLHFRFRGF